MNSVRMTRAHYEQFPNKQRVIVIHATAGTNSTGWLQQGGSKHAPVSCQYLISKSGNVTKYWGVRGEDLDEITCWHAGHSAWNVDGKWTRYLNYWSIGIEMENLNTGKDPYPKAQYDATVALTKELMARHNIPVDQVVRHLDISPGRKTDPAGFNWEQFKKDIVSTVQEPKPMKISPPKDVVILTTTPVRETWEDDGPVAMNGQHYLVTGTIVSVDEEFDGKYHLTSGSGFISKAHTDVDKENSSFSKDTAILDGHYINGGDYVSEVSAITKVLNRLKVNDEYIPELASAYAHLGRLTGIGTVGPLAQAILETDSFTSRPWVNHYNPAGLGVTGTGVQGNDFSTIFEGILAQYAHLLTYARGNVPDGSKLEVLMELSPRYANVIQAEYFADYWDDLSGKWAVDLEYGIKIEKRAQLLK